MCENCDDAVTLAMAMVTLALDGTLWDGQSPDVLEDIADGETQVVAGALAAMCASLLKQVCQLTGADPETEWRSVALNFADHGASS